REGAPYNFAPGSARAIDRRQVQGGRVGGRYKAEMAWLLGSEVGLLQRPPSRPLYFAVIWFPRAEPGAKLCGAPSRAGSFDGSRNERIAFLLFFPSRWSRTLTTFRQIGIRRRTFGSPRAT